ERMAVGAGASRGGGRRSAMGVPLKAVAAVGGRTLGLIDHVGGAVNLFLDALRWVWRGLSEKRVRLGVPAMASQIIRVGVRSIFIVSLVSGCVGLILALQLAPPLDELGQRDKVANIVGVAVLRELGPLIGAIVLTGFAGASIAAEIGTMVVSEEIEALEAHALNPVRFLVVPRVTATILSMTVLGVLSNVVAIMAAIGVSISLLDIPYSLFMTNMLMQVELVDFLTGVGKATIFGMLIGVIACTNGLKVTGGAAGVGNATTQTVVQCVVAIVIADLVFTAIFYALKLF
ncbi:MAG: ABC transporter permease, partial [Phycisphaeraceae bacterium]|nr:ABC transporter permease [Phycisphaeraceae bacterium]